MWCDTGTTADDTRAATKVRACIYPLSAGSRIYWSAVYDTLQLVVGRGRRVTIDARCSKNVPGRRKYSTQSHQDLLSCHSKSTVLSVSLTQTI